MCEEGQLCLDLGAPLDPFPLLMIVSAGLITRLLRSFPSTFVVCINDFIALFDPLRSVGELCFCLSGLLMAV